MNDWLIHSDYASAPLNIATLVFSVLLAFLIGQTIAWVYMLTHSGLSYSRSFVNSLIVIPMIVTLVMTVMANNLVTAFGMMAVFAIVRFRNILRDTFDSTYILWSLGMGMACGTQRFPVAIVGCLLTGAVILYLSFTNFGSRHRYDVIVNLHWAPHCPNWRICRACCTGTAGKPSAPANARMKGTKALIYRIDC